MEHKRVRIGDLLKEEGYVSEEQIEEAIKYQKDHKGLRIGDALIAMNYISEKQLLQALARRFSLNVVDISDIDVDLDAVSKIPRHIAESNNILAVSEGEGTLFVITNDPTNFYCLEDIRQLTGLYLEIALSDRENIVKAINYYYSEVDAKKAADRADEEYDYEAIDQEIADDDDAPIINFIDNLCKRAYSSGASDIHIEPFEEKTQVRMRIDGSITDFVTISKSIHPSLIARIKIMSDMDIAEKRIPQDGHFRFTMGDQRINMRVSVIPTVFGEKAVLRLLASNSPIDNSGTFGMNEEDYERLKEMLKSPNGIIYITGPTGSGKSTTLYMILASLAKGSINISTIEDPVEKNLANVNQMQVNNQAGLTFEIGLRALLRQDPDVIMVGETRDNETASISVRAAITGHVVLSTLHTNDAPSSIARLADMGVAPYLIASSLTGIVAQRLVKKLCPYCSIEGKMTESEVQFLGARIPAIRKPKGCNNCGDSGYQGRIAIHEVLIVDKCMRDMISNNATTDELREYAREAGMKLLKERGLELVRQGITSVDEIMRVAYFT